LEQSLEGLLLVDVYFWLLYADYCISFTVDASTGQIIHGEIRKTYSHLVRKIVLSLRNDFPTDVIVSPDMRMPSLPVVSDDDLAPSVFDLDSYNESLSRNSPANANNHETASWVRNCSPEYASLSSRA